MKDALNAAYPDAAVADTLAARVAARLEAPQKATRRRFLAPALAAAALAGLGLYAAPRWLSPKPVYALEKISKALQNIKTIHISEYAGKWHSSEQWFQGTDRRYDHCSYNSDSCHLYYLDTQGKHYEALSETKIIAVSALLDEPTHGPVRSLTEILHAQELNDLVDRTHFEGRQKIDGREADVIKIDLPWVGVELGSALPKPRYQKLFVDSKTDLPFRIETWTFEGTGWSTVRREIRFDEPVPPGTFSTSFPGMTVKPSSVVASESFYKRLQQPNIGKRATTDKNAVTVLNFSVMEALGLVVWYTVDDERSLPTVALTGKGNVCPLLAQGVVGDLETALRQRYTLKGKRLRWAYFHQTFVAPMGNGDWTVAFTFPEGSATVKPEVAGFESTLPSGEAGDEIGKAFPTLAGERARDRAEYFLDGRWKDDAPLLSLVQQGQLNPLEQALFWLREAVRQDSKWLTAPKHARDWRRMAEVLDQLKRSEEAKTYRAKASAEG